MINPMTTLTQQTNSRRWVLPFLAAVIAALAAILLGTTASAAAAETADTRVRASADPVAVLVGPPEHISAGQRLGNEPTGVVTVVATGVAANAAAKGDHIVLGLRANGLEGTASKVGGRTLLDDPEWMSSLQKAIGDPSTKFTVSLDGMSGSSTYNQVMNAVQRGAGAGKKGWATDWEMLQLQQGAGLPDVTFVRGGSVVPNPWAP